MMLVRALAALLAVSCGGARATTGPQPDLDNMKMYEPFAMRDDAKRPHQAVILGTDAKGGSTVIKLPARESRVTVDASGVRVTLATAPNPDGTVQVGIYETRADTTGTPQWRAGVWVAALVAANTLGKDLMDFTFSASAAGEIDGPSASALIAAGFLVTMTGATVDPSATLTGTINADGTVGPVGGVAEKFKAALAQGKKKVGYPSGMRRVHVDATNVVDLAELAKASGAVAVEIANVHDAYKLLTGTALPASIPVAASEMAVDPETKVLIEAKYNTWRIGVDAKLAQLRQPPASLAAVVTSAERMANRAQALRARGSVAAAFSELVGASIQVSAATGAADILGKVSGGDLAGAEAALATIEHLEPNRALRVIAEVKPTTIGGHISMMAAFQSALRGAGFASLARYHAEETVAHLRTLAGKSPKELASPTEVLVGLVVRAEHARARSATDSTIAVERLEYEKAKSIGYMCSIPNVIRLATSFRSASTAGISFFEAMRGITNDTARMQIATSEPDYTIAYALSRLDVSGEDIKKVLGETSIAWNLMVLAGAERAYIDSAQLTAKYYALDENKYLAASDRETAVARMLTSAEYATRASARAALVATGAIPVQAKITYELATSLRDGDSGEKLAALVSYWAATTYLQTAVMLSRN